MNIDCTWPTDNSANAEYYLLAHASRFLAPGAVRVESDSPATLPGAQVAFRNPDHSIVSIVLIAFSNADHPTTLSIATANGFLSATAPQRALITITWRQ